MTECTVDMLEKEFNLYLVEEFPSVVISNEPKCVDKGYTLE